MHSSEWSQVWTKIIQITGSVDSGRSTQVTATVCSTTMVRPRRWWWRALLLLYTETRGSSRSLATRDLSPHTDYLTDGRGEGEKLLATHESRHTFPLAPVTYIIQCTPTFGSAWSQTFWVDYKQRDLCWKEAVLNYRVFIKMNALEHLFGSEW